jgi:hypothetical protein
MTHPTPTEQEEVREQLEAIIGLAYNRGCNDGQEARRQDRTITEGTDQAVKILAQAQQEAELRGRIESWRIVLDNVHHESFKQFATEILNNLLKEQKRLSALQTAGKVSKDNE